ncbi:hypothetical protein B0J11DRAFT_486844 [Dendryphion nanum]|uniref:JmjC domain-containing protein n=1 Tax=Dendryphion nanum TaxID=256645 RepID=A0A9P9DTB2_9PLEO|nr:hypothetical protein B0J11DRAFT_486844 [Dendryphion nanum]
MPAARPRASFEPIPPDFDVRTFVETADNFQYVDRISYEMIASNGMEQFEKLVLLHVIIGGKPLVIDGFEEVLDPWTFTPSWLRDNHGDRVENACNLTIKDNIPLTIKHYLKHLGKLTEQFFNDPERYRDKTRQRIYLKDIDCPQVWESKLKEHIPSSLFYLNDSTGEVGGPGALDEPGFRKGRGIGRAGDLMSSLPPEMRAENLMCYIGHEGTYTPSHREMCASLGQNIMVNASANISDDGKPERPGSSIWFMTEMKDRHMVSEYWLSVLGHDIEVENHFAQLIAWKKAPFKTYVVEQRPGDFILIPPLAPHQVWNRGTRTVKIAWNRTTVETLEMAMAEALPNSRIVCRDEQYKNKSIVYYTLLKYSNLIKSVTAQVELGGEQAEAIKGAIKVRHVQRDFKRLFDLYKQILLSEMFSPDSREHCEFLPYDSNVTCAYCRCNIFNRFLSCKSCKNAFSEEMDEPYDICMDCYCMGRSCYCQSGYQWVEQWKWKDLVHKYEKWRAQIIDIDGQMTDKTPLPLSEERRYLGKKTLAQVCQEQLKLRPFKDPNAPQPVEHESDDEEIEVNEDGIRKPPKKKSKQWLQDHKSCHVCLHRHPKWKMAFCSNCDLAYCYGTLFRAHDNMPLTVMENPNWKCPHCWRTCNTGACRRDPRQHPYEPKGTLLGHDTKKVADPRSVECLVDFSVSNLNWLREDESTGPMQRHRDEAERNKQVDPTQDDRFMDEENHQSNRNGIAYSPVEDSMADPQNRSAFVNPSSVQYQPDNTIHDDDYDPYYPNPDMNGDIPRLGKRTRDNEEEDQEMHKRKRSKKRRTKDEPSQRLQPKNVSGKQYQKEIEKKLLDEAKKDNRFILVAARMKGISKIVKLSLPIYLLDEIRSRSGPDLLQPELQEASAQMAGSILESDVLKPKPAPKASGIVTKAPKSFRVPIDKDESYGHRRRDGPNGAAGKAGKPHRTTKHYEEVTINSDGEFDEDDVEYTGPRRGRGKGRSSAWLARKNEGEDEDLPTELPADFRDGTINHRPRDRERDKEMRERRRTLPEKQQAGIRLPGRASRNSTGNMLGTRSDDDGLREEDGGNGEAALMLAQSAAAALEATRKAEAEKARAAAAAKEAEENLRAKMAIWDSGSEDEEIGGFFDSFAAEDDPLHEREDIPVELSPERLQAPTRSGPPQSEHSLFSRPGMAGKKIKVTASKRNGENGATMTMRTATITAPVPSVRKSARAVDLSEESGSDSDDEIPARALTPKKTASRTGRPSLVPTRGGSAVGARGRGRGRGRGRPRGS